MLSDILEKIPLLTPIELEFTEVLFLKLMPDKQKSSIDLLNFLEIINLPESIVIPVLYDLVDKDIICFSENNLIFFA